ncbi:type II toxin-antitoxin system Phd/YefM family antitoxin [Terracidiphilus sp.]|jgi:prevent-host-death family protein|uniref:type II toxin-antitoxin system Phd/YefM family antitoxin n=1 Tax=Terracidiphilus sp. TaxID=1964191 RepID=UPI003C24C2AD
MPQLQGIPVQRLWTFSEKLWMAVDDPSRSYMTTTPLKIAIIYGYNFVMQVSTAEAKDRLPELIRAMEGGEQVVITRHGKPVAEIMPPRTQEKRTVILGGMRDRIKLYPGWDEPITEEELLGRRLHDNYE